MASLERRRSPPPPPTSAAARAAARGAPPPWAGPAGRHHHARRRAHRIDARGAPSGTMACLRLAARTASKSRLGQRSHQRRAGCRRSAPRARSSRTSGRPAKRATISMVRSSAVGPRPPLVTIRSTPCVGHEAQLRLHVLRTVAADGDVGQLDPELAAGGRTARGRCGRGSGRSAPRCRSPRCRRGRSSGIRRRDAAPSGIGSTRAAASNS